MPNHFIHRVKRLFQRHFQRDERSAAEVNAEAETPAPRQHGKAPHATARPARRQADIPLDVLGRTYTPPVTSSKTSFRSDGSDHHRDQELTPATASERWSDEDRYTNKSGDPRIGTHRRTYEPGEAGVESHD